ncbi:hypothetical protein M2367_002134 [Aeromonas sp. BIGb0445]|nr:hypothetical protein [Aeromonas sp. BIGb0445]
MSFSMLNDESRMGIFGVSVSRQDAEVPGWRNKV